MKTKIVILVITLFFPLGSFANDGEFFSAGSTLFPVKETSIELQKEILSLKKSGGEYSKWMNVDVYFEFYNPSDAKTITVGFVTPPWDDFEYKEGVHPDIKNFTVIMNGEPLKYEIKYLDSSTFSFNKKGSDRKYFVFYFNAVFNEGVNVIQHSYLFKGGGSNTYGSDYQYQITTGKGWAGGEIKSFELNIDLGEGTHYLPATFWNDEKPVNWKIVGTGFIYPSTERLYEYGDEFKGPLVRMVNIQSGYITYSAKNFKPDNDIIVGDYHFRKEVSNWCDCEEKNLFEGLDWTLYYLSSSESYNNDNREKISKEELNLIKEYIYARKGYVSDDRKVQDIFTKFLWYIPNYSLRKDDILFNEEEQKILDSIEKLEKEK